MIRSVSLFLFSLFWLAVSLPTAAAPARWVISDDDTTILLFGTIHALRPDVEWLDSGLRSDIGRMDGIFLELAPEQQVPEIMNPLVIEHGLLKNGEQLAALLDSETYTTLQKRFQAAGMVEAQYGQLRPWMAGITLTVIEFAKQGFNPELGVEKILTRIAGENGVPVAGLETAEYQIGRFAGLPRAQEVHLLTLSLDQLSDTGKLIGDMTDFWTAGDVDGLGNLLTEEMKKTPELAERLLYERNRNWVGQMKEILAQPGTYMVAVGAGHLTGDQSLIELLEKDGVAVKRVGMPGS